MNDVIYRAESYLDIRKAEICGGRTLERLTDEERKEVESLQKLTEDLAGLQVDLGAMRAELVTLYNGVRAAGTALASIYCILAVRPQPSREQMLDLSQECEKTELCESACPIAEALVMESEDAALAAAERKGEG